VTDVAKLREEVTHARVAAVLAEARAAWVEEIAHERAVLLAIAQEEADEAAQRFSILEGELRAAHRAQSAIKEKLPSLAAKAVTSDR
jgi:hypothetical protein